MTQINSNDSKDLIQSALTLSWEICEYPVSAQDYIEEIIELVDKKNYEVNKDWVYKMFLMLFGENLDMQPLYFMAATTPNVPQSVYANHQLIYDCVGKAFDLVADFHLLEKDLTNKLAVLPIVYFIYKQKLSKTAILPTNSMSNVFEDMKKYLCRAIIKDLYESKTDDILKNIKDIIDTKSLGNYFPYSDIVNAYDKLIITPSEVDKLTVVSQRLMNGCI